MKKMSKAPQYNKTREEEKLAIKMKTTTLSTTVATLRQQVSKRIREFYEEVTMIKKLHGLVFLTKGKTEHKLVQLPRKFIANAVSVKCKMINSYCTFGERVSFR